MALAVSLVMLLLVTLLALAGLRGSVQELRLALNDELGVSAFEQAQSLVDAALRSPANTPVLPNDRVLCARPGQHCSAPVVLPDGFAAAVAAGHVNVTVRRLAPDHSPPPVGSGFSAERFASAALRLEGRYDRATDGFGAAQVAEGVAVVFPSGGEIFTTR